MGAQEWLHGLTVPDNAPTFPSARLDELQALGSDFPARLPDSLEGWSTAERLVWLQAIPPLDDAGCALLSERYGLAGSGNAELESQWLVMALSAGHQPAIEPARRFVSRVGRMKFLKPIYKALVSTRPGLARQWLDELGERYHPIARQGLESMVG